MQFQVSQANVGSSIEALNSNIKERHYAVHAINQSEYTIEQMMLLQQNLENIVKDNLL